jgi:periplasmic protein CpxP/Spy
MMPNAMETKRMRTAAVLLCGAMLAVLPAMAQQDAPPPPSQGQTQGGPHGRGGMMNPEQHAAHLQKALGLSDDQTAQVKAIFTDEQTKGQALWQNTSLSREDRHTQMEALRQDEDTKVQGVLTADQKTKYAALQAQMREHRGDQQNGNGGAPPPPSA